MDEIIAHFGDPFSFEQLIGWVGTVLYLISFQCKDNRKTFRYHVPADACYLVQYGMFGAVSAFIVTVSSVVRSALAGWGR